MRTFAYTLIFLGITLLTGCSSTRIYHQPFAEVKAAVQQIEREAMIKSGANLRVPTNDFQTNHFRIRILDNYFASAFVPFTEITVVPRGVDESRVDVYSRHDELFNRSRRREIEAATLNRLSEILQKP